MTAFCARCGLDVEADAPISLGAFSMQDEASPLFYHGHKIDLTFAEGSLCWSLLKAYPHIVSKIVLLDRMDSIAHTNVAAVAVCRVRIKLRAYGVDPIETVPRRGYRWRP